LPACGRAANVGVKPAAIFGAVDVEVFMPKSFVCCPVSLALWPSLLTLALASAACSGEGGNSISSNGSADDDSTQSASALSAEEQAGVDATAASLATSLEHGKPLRRVKPILECVDQVSKSTYVAHFGWDNTSSGAVVIPVGPSNRFFPAPKDRGQDVTFAQGRQRDKVKLTFSAPFVAWILDGRFAIALKSSPRCPPPPPVCPDSCDDHNPCTLDVCDATSGGKCAHRPLPSGTSCTDQNVCNGAEICDANGVCASPGAITCTDDGNACTIETCDAAVGCHSTAGNEGGACKTSDGKDGTCGGGSCTSGSLGFERVSACETCEATGIANGDCDPLIGCSHIVDMADRALCESLDRCMRTTGCWLQDPIDCLCGTAKGVDCASSAANGVCKAEIQAATKSTDPVVNGTYFYSLRVPAGFATQQAACDLDICREPCTLLSCAAGVPDCDDKNPCTADGCLLQGGCGHTAGNDGWTCTAPSGATGTCSAGVCLDPLCRSLDSCTTAVFSNGTCVMAKVPDGTPCNDGVRCTTGDACSNGTCGGQPLVCPPASVCGGQPSCSEATGTCLYPPGPTTCDRSATCLTCEKGAIDSGACDSNIGCSKIANSADRALCRALDTCMRTTGCWSTDPIDCLCGTAKGVACASSAANGVCKAEVQAATKTTDPVANGTLFYSFAVPAGFATQQAACDLDDCRTQCSTPSCQPGGSVCDDQNECMLDSCADGSGCAHVPINGTACTAASGAIGSCAAGACVDSICHPLPCQAAVFNNGTCVIANAPDGTACDDNLRCTTADACTKGVCGGQPLVCPRGAGCTGAPSCEEATGSCKYPPENTCGRPLACLACEQDAVFSGDCDGRMGCGHITNAADRALCEALDQCMRATGCWSHDPLDCLCGTAKGLSCASSAANGACKAEVQAATKTTDPLANGTLFYNLSVPAGFATQQAACDRDLCLDPCSKLSQ
jgi:hypothetical protein